MCVYCLVVNSEQMFFNKLTPLALGVPPYWIYTQPLTSPEWFVHKVQSVDSQSNAPETSNCSGKISKERSRGALFQGVRQDQVDRKTLFSKIISFRSLFYTVHVHYTHTGAPMVMQSFPHILTVSSG